MLFDMLRLYIGKALAVAKAHIFWVIIVSFILTIGYQRIRISSLETQVQEYQDASERAQTELSKCESDFDEKNRNYKFLLEYYRERKPFDLKDGPVPPSLFDDLKQRN